MCGRKLPQAGAFRRQQFKRRERRSQSGGQCVGQVQFVIRNSLSRIARMQQLSFSTERRQRMCEVCAAALRARATQHGALKRCACMATIAGAEPAERMLQQSEQRHRRQSSEPCLGDQPREYAGRSVGQRIAGGIVDRYVPAFERCKHPARQPAIRRYQCSVLL
jgi:hypothetical protein